VSPGNEGSLANLADQRLIFTDLPAGSLEEVLTEISRRLAAAGAVPDGEELKRRLLERERLGCTGLGGGVAIPHCKIRGISDIVFSIGSAPAGVDFHAADGIPVTLIFLILSPADAPATHLQALARAGLITSKRVGQWTFYRRDEAAIAALKRRIGEEL